MSSTSFFPGFRNLLFGRPPISRHETFMRQRTKLIASSLSEYALQFESFLSAEFLEALSSTKRERHYGNVTTFWAWLSQIMDQNASCSKAVSRVQSWCAQAQLPIPSSDTGAYCLARKRLASAFLKGANDHLLHLMRQRIRPEDCWHGHVLKAIDGTSVKLMDTVKNQERYPQPSTQKPGCGFPVMGMVGIINLSHGAWDAFATAKNDTHDLTVTGQLMEHFISGDLVLADRAFCSYELIAQLQLRGVQSLMRLHQSRHRALDWRDGKKISKNERLVTWSKPAHSKKSLLTEEQWEALPETLSIRLIKHRCEGRDKSQRDILIATTLTDLKYTGEELAALYEQRWDIEVKIRDIKTTLGMEDFAVKTPDMAEKTLSMIMIAYNLMKAVSQQAAIKNGQSLAMMGFKGALDIVVSYRGNYLGHQRHPFKRILLHQTLIKIICSKLLHKRPGRKEPRALKKRPKPFSLLTAPRHKYIEIQHRSNYRKVA